MSKPMCYLSFLSAPSVESTDHHDIAAFSEDISVSALVNKSLEAGRPGFPDKLNQQLQGREVVADSQAEIDALHAVFAREGVAPAFTVEVISDGWVSDMLDDYHRIQHEFLSKQADTRALTKARAMQEAHTKMIPL